MITKEMIAAFADELRKWWAFDNRQVHTHTWHTREDFIRDKLPELLTAALSVQWRGMESAPKDGTPAIVATVNGNVGEASCHEDGYWYWAGGGPHEYVDGAVDEPTGWQPLPPPPASKE